jgi:hypothetical protein
MSFESWALCAKSRWSGTRWPGASKSVHVVSGLAIPEDPSQVPFIPQQPIGTRPVPATEGEEAGIFLSARRYDDVNGY